VCSSSSGVIKKLSDRFCPVRFVLFFVVIFNHSELGDCNKEDRDIIQVSECVVNHPPLECRYTLFSRWRGVKATGEIMFYFFQTRWTDRWLPIYDFRQPVRKMFSFFPATRLVGV